MNVSTYVSSCHLEGLLVRKLRLSLLELGNFLLHEVVVGADFLDFWAFRGTGFSSSFNHFLRERKKHDWVLNARGPYLCCRLR